jgi:peptide chain release factor 1
MRSAQHVIIFEIELVERREGVIIFRALGKGTQAKDLFANESGGHRWQRIPPNDKRGRVHTSTITVAVLPEPTSVEVVIKESDLDVKTCRAGSAGGQHVNKTESAVQMTHLPTGISVRCETERSQNQNRASALALLRARIWDQERMRQAEARAADRKKQVGIGARGDKRRTIRVQDGQVHDHITNQRWDLKPYLRGDW